MVEARQEHGEGQVSDAAGHAAADRRDGFDEPDELSLVQLVNIFLRHRRLLVGLPLLLAALAVGFAAVRSRTYTATASFMPHAEQSQVSRLAGLAAQFGVSVPTGSEGQSPAFYRELVQSRGILQSLVTTEFSLAASSGDSAVSRGTLVELMEIEGDREAEELAIAVEAVRNRLTITTDDEIGLVSLSVQTWSPELSRAVAERLIALVNEFNLDTRRSQASSEREFIQEQVARAEHDLLAAEDSLQAFLQKNRRYENSPELTFEFERLQRRVALRQQVFTSLAQSLEQARVDEVRNTPVITVVEHPVEPIAPDPRGLILRAVVGLVLGGLLAVGWVMGREFLEHTRRAAPEDYREFQRLRREARDEVRGLFPWSGGWSRRWRGAGGVPEDSEVVLGQEGPSGRRPRGEG